MLSSRPRVLLADDYPDIVKAVSRLLALDCEIVGTVADGSALLETAQRLQPDVIVLDVHLPERPLAGGVSRDTRVNPEMKVIMFTAVADPNVGQAFSRPEHLPSSRKRRPWNCCRPSSACVATEADGLVQTQQDRRK